MRPFSFTSGVARPFAGRFVGPAIALAISGLLVASCSSAGPSSGSGGSGSPGQGTSAPGSGSGGGGGANASGSPLFPIAVGNTWVYTDTLATSGHGTTTNKVTAVQPGPQGNRVTLTTTTDIAGLPHTATKLIYLFHPDGSITVPFAQVGSASVTVKSGSIVWPSQATLDSGQPHKSTLVIGLKAAGHSLTVSAHVTVQGLGKQTVTVPAGTYHATVVSETISEHVEGITVTIAVRTWLATGVGPVKSQATTKAASASQIVSVEVLKSFTKG